MGLRETISNLSPNEFLAKMQDMISMYMESVNSIPAIQEMEVIKDENIKEQINRYYKTIQKTMEKHPELDQIIHDSFDCEYYVQGNKYKEKINFRCLAIRNDKNDKIAIKLSNIIDEIVSAHVNIGLILNKHFHSLNSKYNNGHLFQLLQDEVEIARKYSLIGNDSRTLQRCINELAKFIK